VDKLNKLIEVAKRVGLVAVVEVHSEGELDIALKLENYEVILINNRNLYTFEVDVSNAIRLKLRIPKNRLIIAASGINRKEEVILLKERGMDALLLGEVLLTSHNIGATLRELNLR
jgi:indole-3-glycerol phosphate synthase